MNPAQLMNIRAHFLQNKENASIEEYRSVILDLVMEVERLNADKVVYSNRFNNMGNK